MTVDQDSHIDDADGVDDLDVNGDNKTSDERRTRMHWVRAGRRALGAGFRWVGRNLVRWRFIVLAVAVVAAVSLAAGLFFFQYRPDQQTDDAAAQAAVTAASEGTVAILSYSADSVDHDLTVAKSYLTGEFLRYWGDFSQHFVAPAVRQQQVRASATVLRAAVSELHPDSAVVLLFIHQTSTNKDKTEPEVTSNNVRATLTKVDGSWLISKFEPV
jgi:Mce-associated membrane protein